MNQSSLQSLQFLLPAWKIQQLIVKRNFLNFKKWPNFIDICYEGNFNIRWVVKWQEMKFLYRPNCQQLTQKVLQKNLQRAIQENNISHRKIQSKKVTDIDFISSDSELDWGLISNVCFLIILLIYLMNTIIKRGRTDIILFANRYLYYILH